MTAAENMLCNGSATYGCGGRRGRTGNDDNGSSGDYGINIGDNEGDDGAVLYNNGHRGSILSTAHSRESTLG